MALGNSSSLTWFTVVNQQIRLQSRKLWYLAITIKHQDLRNLEERRNYLAVLIFKIPDRQ